MKTWKELLFCSLFYVSISPIVARDLKGHLEPLFSHGKRLEVEVYEGFPTPEEFYKKFVIISRFSFVAGLRCLLRTDYGMRSIFFLSLKVRSI